LESRYNELTTPSILRGLIEPGPDVARRLADAEQSTRRTLARILFSPEFLGELLIIRSPQVGRFADRVPIHERVVLRRAQLLLTKEVLGLVVGVLARREGRLDGGGRVLRRRVGRLGGGPVGHFRVSPSRSTRKSQLILGVLPGFFCCCRKDSDGSISQRWWRWCRPGDPGDHW